jgi:hypothetical protein
MSPADNFSASSARATGRINSKLMRWSSSSRRFPWRRFAPYLGTALALSLCTPPAKAAFRRAVCCGVIAQ